MSILKNEKGENYSIGDWILGIIIIIGFIWLLVANKGGGGFGCYEDQYGNEICHEDPRS